MIEEFFLLAIIGFIAAFINSIAGGGGLTSYTTLTTMGFVPLEANMITAIGLWPGNLSGVFPFYKGWQAIFRSEFLNIVITLIGGVIGAVILLNTKEKTFTILVPFLLLFVFILFLLKKEILSLSAYWIITKVKKKKGQVSLISLVYLIAGIYGAYFGAGLGLILLALLSVDKRSDLQELNKIKMLLVLLNTTVAVLIFLMQIKLQLQTITFLTIGSIPGGWLGMRWSQHIPSRWFNQLVLLLSGTLSIYYFLNI